MEPVWWWALRVLLDLLRCFCPKHHARDIVAVQAVNIALSFTDALDDGVLTDHVCQHDPYICHRDGCDELVNPEHQVRGHAEPYYPNKPQK